VIKWSRDGIDAADINSGSGYDMLPEKDSNTDRHVKRIPNELFRMIKF
jgi:hypothetical protein|tara:strand:- start:322 stop:465 length:144 start_codon:yes stop_codon:yes gene_type:complete